MKYREYIKPELLILIPVLCFVGAGLKYSEKINDKYIPLILGAIGIALSTIYVLASEGFGLMGVFTAITQGILVAGAAVYANQIAKQNKK